MQKLYVFLIVFTVYSKNIERRVKRFIAQKNLQKAKRPYDIKEARHILARLLFYREIYPTFYGQPPSPPNNSFGGSGKSGRSARREGREALISPPRI